MSGRELDEPSARSSGVALVLVRFSNVAGDGDPPLPGQLLRLDTRPVIILLRRRPTSR